MKKFFFLLLILSQFAVADEIPCEIPGNVGFTLPREMRLVRNIVSEEKKRFLTRHAIPAGGWSLGLKIESNFRIPFVGNVPYFGRIYFKKGDPHIRYRDEMVASDHYRDESENPRFYNTSSMTVSRMNSRDGYEVATGVKIFGQNLNTNTGGRMTLSVKPPGGRRMLIPVDVSVVNNRMVNSVTVNGRRMVFDTLKINANGGSILRGLSNVQLMAGGRVVHTITN
jgi:hypothetical protein